MLEVYNMRKVNIAEKFSMFNEYWSPKIIGELNDSYVKAAKLKGKFDWHTHENEDELFLVIKGSLVIKTRDEDIYLKEGEFFIVPKGIEHLPIAEEEAHVLFIEPKSTLNTGNVINEKTKQQLPKI
jgi:mannose-6-phosphate isomerase-like protein (cupin superfamily)